MKAYKKSTATYPFYSVDIGSIEELLDLEYPTKYFVLLLAADFSEIESDIPEIAKKLINKGLLWVCTWGHGCSKAEFDFDLGNVIFWEETGKKDVHVMSTSHDNEPLEEALWFCLFSAPVDDEFWHECSTIIITINGKKEWIKTIETALSNIPAFNNKMLEEK